MLWVSARTTVLILVPTKFNLYRIDISAGAGLRFQPAIE